MARRWTKEEEKFYRSQLNRLYIVENKSIGQIGKELGIAYQTVFDRLRRLDIKTAPKQKLKYRNQRSDIRLPRQSARLAEFLGIMLGDGHISHFQTIVTLGTKEFEYVQYVQALMQELFKVKATISIKRSGYRDVYVGSTLITKWLREQGLVSNKVAAQVGVPEWIMGEEKYMRAFVRGFFDTDGSVYNLCFGIQVSLTNKSAPLLLALQDMLRKLGYQVSEVSAYRVYITKRKDVERFFREIAPANLKHRRRFDRFLRRYLSGQRGRAVNALT